MAEKIFELIIIGAGPSGLMASSEATKKGLAFILIEKNDAPGKKLLVTGGGQCNFTHNEPLTQFLEHYHEKHFLWVKLFVNLPRTNS